MSSDLAGGADTIVAVATGHVRAALAMIRLSGPEVGRLANEVCPALAEAAPRVASLISVIDGDGETLETGLGVRFAGPRSYTGEDMLELTVHGSPYLVERVVEAFTAAGARPARRGEFTRRAVANGKMDLLQAEAVRDLVAAETDGQLRNARRLLRGELSVACGELRTSLVEARAVAEAALDFEAQGLEVDDGLLARVVAGCLRQVEGLMATAAAGDRLRRGLRIAISGPPNSGKSTFFNNLCGFERAIVAPAPGTTRDVVEARLEIAGRPVVVSDTAGLRTTRDEVEAEGRRRALAAAADADLVVWMEAVDAAAEEATRREVEGGVAEVIRVRSKADLASDDPAPSGWLRLSCHSGEGMSSLLDRLHAAVAGECGDASEGVMIGARHQASLARAREELARCPTAQPELAVEHIRWAFEAVSELVGEASTEEVLERVFRDFCIGK